MYQRFHQASKLAAPKDKWQSVPRMGVSCVVHEEHDGWQLEICHRRIGSVIRRDQYSVTIHRTTPAYQEYLSGFSSKMAAVAAGRRRIELLRRIEHRPHRPPPSRARWSRVR